ncbi:MAG: diguanylate cyclase [Gammaproteobacteria bacterium]
MVESSEFMKLVLDSITENIAVIDGNGDILFVNKSWICFGKNNSCMIGENWTGVNYLAKCDKAAAMGDDYASKAAIGIREVINQSKEFFYLEYPCHSPDEMRWFMMHVTSFILKERYFYVISHQNITQRKLAEEKALNLSRIDGLTGIPNRRYFDEFLEAEWKRCRRLNMPISLAIMDIDRFKLLNDTYGHQKGDECLKQIGGVLKELSKRPDDLCARYGGEEFAMVYGNTTLEQAIVLVEKVLFTIRSLNVPHGKTPTHPIVTVSIGLSCMRPGKEHTESELIAESDKLLYSAKRNGGDQILFSEKYGDFETHA